MRFFPEVLRSGLARRYFIAIGGAVSAVLLLAIGVETPQAYKATLERVGAMQSSDLRNAATRVEEYLQGVEAALRESAAIPWLAPVFDAERLRVELHRLMKLVPALDHIVVTDASGAPRASVSRLGVDNDPAAAVDAGLFKAAVENGMAIGPMQFEGGFEPAVTLVVRGSRASGGVIAARLNMRNVSDIVSGLRVGDAGEAFLVEGSDRIVAHRDSARTMQRLSEHGRRQIAGLRERLKGDPPLAPPAETIDADGTPTFASAIALPRLGWMIVAQEPLEAALAPVRATVLRLLAIMGSGILIAIFVGAMLARRLTQPIVTLREGARRIAKGDLDSRITVQTGDEIEELGGDFNHMAAQLRDYTTGLERKVAEQTTELRGALQTAHDAMRARSLFLAAASHDLRQPLYAISILADALGSHALTPETRAVLEKQRQAIAALRGLFDNLLDLSRLEAGEVRPMVRVASLREALTPLAGEYQALAEAKGLRWSAQIDDAWVRTDPELLRRVLANLLANAVRYTLRGDVRLRAVLEGDQVLFEVADTGIGIALENQSRVFEEFVQLENAARDRDKGVGLGLSIVKKIGELLDMHVRLESTPAEGTRVSFQVPATEAPPVQPSIAPPADESTDIAGMRVWIVEDDQLVREALAMQLDAWSVDHDFGLRREDLARLRESDGAWPDAVMLDDMLGSGEGGLELALWLADQMPRERIAIATGNVDPRRLADMEAQGFFVLRKPLTGAELGAWLRKARALEGEAAIRFPAGAPAG